MDDEELLELIPWQQPDFDRDFAAKDSEFLQLYNHQLTSWNRFRKSWQDILQSLLNEAGKPPFPENGWEQIICDWTANYEDILAEYKSFHIGEEAKAELEEFQISY